MAADLATEGRLRRIAQLEITPRTVKPIHLMNFCRFLSVFLTAGIPILDALDTIQEDSPDKKLKEVVGEIVASLRAGDSFSTAVAAHDKAFPGFFVSMVASAEVTGQLAPVLGQIAKYLERDIEARRKFRSALTYPAAVIGLSIVSVAILVGFVLPRFVDFFDEYDTKLPLATRILIDISHFVVDFGVLLAVLAAVLVATIGGVTLIGEVRQRRDRMLLRVPLVGRVLRYAAVERFCRILSSMVQAGVPLPIGLDLAAAGSSNRAFRSQLAVARQEMIEGAGLSGPLARTGLFPTAAVQMLKVGEETGTLDERLEEMSDFYGKELEHRLKSLTDLLEPAAVIIVGLVVGFVAIAIVSAIYGVFNGTKIT